MAKAKKEKKEKKLTQKQKKQLEPEFYASATNIPTLNYKVYYMKPLEKLLTFLLAFLVGAAIGYLFYGGIGKDRFGRPTTLTHVLNILIPTVTGLIAARLFLPVRVKSIISRRSKELARQFRDMLESLTTSLGAGKNVHDAFISVYDDMKVQYESDAYILNELNVIVTGLNNSVHIEDVLEDFGKRSGNEDIMSFASVFRISYRQGGNIRDVIRNTHSILSDKMEIAEDIQTLVTSNRTEQNIMMAMPVALITIIKLMSPEFAANFTTPSGIISTTFSIGIFIVAYFVGRAILDIKL